LSDLNFSIPGLAWTSTYLIPYAFVLPIWNSFSNELDLFSVFAITHVSISPSGPFSLPSTAHNTWDPHQVIEGT